MEQDFKDAIAEHVAMLKLRQQTCEHEDYSFEQHGRCCPHCMTVMTDFGD